MSKKRIAENFGKAACHYDESAALQRRVGERLWLQMESVLSVNLCAGNTTLIDLGCGSGYFTKKIKQRIEGKVIGLDISSDMLNYSMEQCQDQKNIFFVNADAEKIPLQCASADVIFSNFVLQWCDDLRGALGESLRILKPGGCLAFSMPIEGTLIELESCWKSVDGNRHVNSFYSKKEIETMLLSALDERELDSSSVDINISSYQCANYYETFKDILQDLKQVGANTVKGARSGGLMGKTRFAYLAENYERFRNEKGLPATYQVLNVIVERKVINA